MSEEIERLTEVEAKLRAEIAYNHKIMEWSAILAVLLGPLIYWKAC